jgi:hypothetical protein
VIGLPPLYGALQETVIVLSPRAVMRPVGASGTVPLGDTGVTAEEGELAELSPTAFVAITVNLYAVPFVRPVIVALVDPTAPVPAIMSLG